MSQALCARPCHRPLHRIDFARLVLSCFKRTIKRLWERKRQVTSLATLHRIRIIHVRGQYIEILSAAEAVQRCVNDDDLWIGIRRRRATMQCNSVSLYLLRWLAASGRVPQRRPSGRLLCPRVNNTIPTFPWAFHRSLTRAVVRAIPRSDLNPF